MKTVLKTISYPSKGQVASLTATVIVAIIVLSSCIFGIDTLAIGLYRMIP